VQHALGRLEEAVASFSNAVVLASDACEARCARATVLAALGRLDEAEADLHCALETAPDHLQARHNLGVLLARRGNSVGALQQYDRVLSIDAQHVGSRENRASLRLARGDAQGALDDYRALCARSQASVDSRRGLVRALLLVHRDEEALRQVERLAEEHPDDRLSRELKAIALASVGRIAEAESCFGGSDARAKARSAFIDRALERQKICEWHDRARLVDTVREVLAEPYPHELASQAVLFHAHGLPLRGSELKAISARVALEIRHQAPKPVADTSSVAVAGDRMRIGFLSSGMRNHPEARLLRRVVADRDRDRFHYFVYALNADDGSMFRSGVAQSVDNFADVSGWPTHRIVETMRADRLDLLVDLSGNLIGARPEVLAARVAPVQANFIGPPCTLGPDLLDYRLSDAVATPPEHQSDWHEKLVLLPAPHWTYDCSQPIGDPGLRAAHGLPQGAFVYCAFHQAFKISPEIFLLWMRLLLQTPDSVLWLLDGGSQVRTNLAQHAKQAGVDPTRLIFAGHAESLEAHLGRQLHADLFLDALYYGAQTTAADALLVGLPIVTSLGDTMASRLCASLMHGAGIPELVMRTLDEYERKALELAGSPSMLAEARGKLNRAKTGAAFFATEDRVRALERAFVAMIERHRAGLQPDTLFVD
jgi:predicted O-linked N-acetylglucosamine transferase (SPINDLY family)